MTIHDEILATLDELYEAHLRDRDGGYSLAFAIRDLFKRADRDRQRELAMILVGRIRTHERLWQVALEALVHLDHIPMSDTLLADVKTGAHDSNWRDEIVFALMSISDSPEPAFYEGYVQEAVLQARKHAVPLLAALARVAPESCCRMTAQFLIDSFLAGNAKAVEGYTPTLVANLIRADERLLGEVLGSMRQENPPAAQWFASCLNAYLGKPWVEGQLGRERLNRLRNDVLLKGGVPSKLN